MKKLYLSIFALLGMGALTEADAQVFSKVDVEPGVTTLHITKSAETLQAEYPQGAVQPWGSALGIEWPASFVMYEDEDVTVSPFTPKAFGFGEFGKMEQVAAETGNKFYINCGCSLKGSEGFNAETRVTSGSSVYGGNDKCNGLIKVSVKTAGILGFKAFCGDNTRSSAIYGLATPEEIAEGQRIIDYANEHTELSDDEYDAMIARGNAIKQGKMVNWINFKGNLVEDPSGIDEHNVPATTDAHDVYAQVEAGRDYVLLCSDVANHNLFEIYFKKGGAPAVVTGDVNGDGVINTADAIAIVNSVIGKPQDKFIASAADVNGDGVVNTADAIAVVNIVIGK